MDNAVTAVVESAPMGWPVLDLSAPPECNRGGLILFRED